MLWKLLFPRRIRNLNRTSQTLYVYTGTETNLRINNELYLHLISHNTCALYTNNSSKNKLFSAERGASVIRCKTSYQFTMAEPLHFPNWLVYAVETIYPTLFQVVQIC